MYTASDIPKYIITKCTRDTQPISNLQLQKILYYVQRQYVKQQDEPLFADVIEAWQFGPVVPNVYYNFCGYGSMSIIAQYPEVKVDQQARQIIDPIVEAKRALNPWDLVEDTHRPDGPWDITYRNGQGNRSVIPIDLIKQKG